MVWVPFSRSGCCPQELSAFPRICELSPGAGTTSSATKRRVFINTAFKFPARAISNHSRDILYLLQASFQSPPRDSKHRSSLSLSEVISTSFIPCLFFGDSIGPQRKFIYVPCLSTEMSGPDTALQSLTDVIEIEASEETSLQKHPSEICIKPTN